MSYVALPANQHANNRRWKYGIEENQYLDLIQRQGGLCASCHVNPPTHVDHDHETGAIRGIICNTCNRGIGLLGDTVEALEKALAYLRSEPPQLIEPVRPVREHKPHVCGVNNSCPGGDELRRMYEIEAWPVRTIVSSIGCRSNYPTLYRYLAAHGIEHRSRRPGIPPA